MATDTHLEEEMKFAVERTFDMPDFRGVVGRSVRKAKRSFRTAYFDTSDLRLWDRGITLRYRSRTTAGPGTWTVKLPEGEAGAMLQRREISWSGAKDEVPPEARELLRGLIRRAGLDQVVEMETTRVPWTLQDHAGRQLAEHDYDDVTVVGGPEDGLCYRQIEIERTDEGADERAISAIADILREAGAEPDDRPKVARALGLTAARPPPPGAKAQRRLNRGGCRPACHLRGSRALARPRLSATRATHQMMVVMTAVAAPVEGLTVIGPEHIGLACVTEGPELVVDGGEAHVLPSCPEVAERSWAERNPSEASSTAARARFWRVDRSSGERADGTSAVVSLTARPAHLAVALLSPRWSRVHIGRPLLMSWDAHSARARPRPGHPLRAAETEHSLRDQWGRSCSA